MVVYSVQYDLIGLVEGKLVRVYNENIFLAYVDYMWEQIGTI